MNVIQIDSVIRMILTLIIQIGNSFLLSQSKKTVTFFWGSIYMIIVIFSDACTFQLGAIFTNYSALERLYNKPISLILTFVYLYICIIMVLIISKKHYQKFMFPWYYYILFSIIIFFGTITVERLLDIILFLENHYNTIQNTLLLSIGFILIILILTIYLIYSMGVLYQHNIDLEVENREKKFEKQQFELLSSTNEMLHIWKHDFHNHLSVINSMIHNKEYLEVQSYIYTINKNINKSSWIKIQTGNNIVDAILSSKLRIINDLNIEFNHHIFLPQLLPISSIDLTSLLGNLMDNAIEACNNSFEGETRHRELTDKYIHLFIKPFRHHLIIEMKNSSNGIYQYDVHHKLLSTKNETGHGIGLKRIRKIVKEADGFIQIQPDYNSFYIKIIIPL